jgi:hypothetical protein
VPRRSWRLAACHRPSHEELPLPRLEDGGLLRRSSAHGRQVLRAGAQPHRSTVQRDCGRAGENSLGADNSSPGRLIHINPPSRSTTRPSPTRPRLSPRYPRPPRAKPCASRESEMGLRQTETGRPHTCNISTEESYPSTRPKLGDWLGAPSRSSYWVMKRSSTTAAPRHPPTMHICRRRTRAVARDTLGGLAVTTQHLEPSWETLSNKISTGRPRWPTPLGLYAPAKGVNSTQDRRTCPLRPCRQYPSPVKGSRCPRGG